MRRRYLPPVYGAANLRILRYEHYSLPLIECNQPIHTHVLSHEPTVRLLWRIFRTVEQAGHAAAAFPAARRAVRSQR